MRLLVCPRAMWYGGYIDPMGLQYGCVLVNMEHVTAMTDR